MTNTNTEPTYPVLIDASTATIVAMFCSSDCYARHLEQNAWRTGEVLDRLTFPVLTDWVDGDVYCMADPCQANGFPELLPYVRRHGWSRTRRDGSSTRPGRHAGTHRTRRLPVTRSPWHVIADRVVPADMFDGFGYVAWRKTTPPLATPPTPAERDELIAAGGMCSPSILFTAQTWTEQPDAMGWILWTRRLRDMIPVFTAQRGGITFVH